MSYELQPTTLSPKSVPVSIHMSAIESIGPATHNRRRLRRRTPFTQFLLPQRIAPSPPIQPPDTHIQPSTITIALAAATATAITTPLSSSIRIPGQSPRSQQQNRLSKRSHSANSLRCLAWSGTSPKQRAALRDSAGSGGGYIPATSNDENDVIRANDDDNYSGTTIDDEEEDKEVQRVRSAVFQLDL